MRKYIPLLLLLMTGQAICQNIRPEKPKLVVAVVVDQMRQEYLYRFGSKYGNAGFNRLMNEGFVLKNAHYNYVPTVTGPGHASVFTGTTPATHGIIGNDWYDKSIRRDVNCVNDPKQTIVGTTEGNGDVSPWRLLTTTISDEMKIATQKRAKVIGLSFKDRGAVLPAGHMPDGAYWYDSKSGHFITSSYYMTKLPEWVEKFNAQNLADKYLSQEWKTFYPIEQYTESGPDDSPYEQKMSGKEKRTFPYNLKELRKKNGDRDLLAFMPFANDYLTEFAKVAVEAEQLGKDNVTDFLSVSYSTPDILGHAVGPNAVELEDMFIRLDKNMEDLLKFLDEKVGQGNYTLFLTADHGVAEVAQYLKDNRIPAGYFSTGNTKATLNEFLQKYFPGREIVESISGGEIFFNQEVFQQDPKLSGVEMMVATELVIKFLLAQDGIANAYSESTLRQGRYEEEGVKGMVIRGYHPKRSGDVIYVLEPGWYSSSRVQGTTHGSPYAYDTSVPVIFFGNGVKKGVSVKYHPITDIAPTLSVMLDVKFPNGCSGQPIEELFR